MAQKVEVLPWNYFKQTQDAAVVAAQSHAETVARLKKALYIGTSVLAGATFALHGIDVVSASALIPHDAITTFAQSAPDVGSFSANLRAATAPIREIIMSFGHEIYGVMMLWGGIEALIGKFQQGVQRMKASTIAYILLVWVPWIVDTVTATAIR